MIEEGISICIPIYNWDARQLATDLIEQAVRVNIPYELIAIDDCSTRFVEANKAIGEMTKASYIRLGTNVGRARIRNMLAEQANMGNVIIIDCDSAVKDAHFIERYVAHRGQDLVVGGCAYCTEEPSPELLLRWRYGKAREEKSAATRIASGSKAFSTFNTMTRREILLSHPYNEKINGYGHEDTLFALNIAAAGIKPLHIDNPLIHLGLDPASVFLQKTENAVRNLKLIYKDESIDKKLICSEIRLLHYYDKMNRICATPLVGTAYSIAEKRIRQNLLGENPSVKVLDFFKLGCLCKE